MAKYNKLPTQEYLKQCLNYDPETGLLYWKERPREHFKTLRAFGMWNARYSGKEAFCRINTGGYLCGELDYINYFAHRLIWKIWYGTEPKQILHSNGNRRDNRISKLSEGTNQDNQKDTKKRENNTSGITGVSWNKFKKRWVAYICIDKNLKHLMQSTDFFEACCARKSAERKYGFHENHGKR